MTNLKLRILVVIFSVVSMFDAHAEGFYVADLDREYDKEYMSAPRFRPRSRKVYVYKDAPPSPPPPRIRPRRVPMYDEQAPAPVSSKMSSGYNGPSFFSQNNFLMFKLGGYKIDGFRGNSEINNSLQGYTVGVGIGRSFSEAINGSVELDILSRAKGEQFQSSQNVLRKWKLSSNMITANASVSMFPGQPIDYYVKVGIGMSYNKSGPYTVYGINNYYYPGSNNYSFAWRGGFGAKFQTLPNLDTSLEYMFTNRGSFKTQNRILGSQNQNADARESKLVDHTISVVVSKNLYN